MNPQIDFWITRGKRRVDQDTKENSNSAAAVAEKDNDDTLSNRSARTRSSRAQSAHRLRITSTAEVANESNKAISPRFPGGGASGNSHLSMKRKSSN